MANAKKCDICGRYYDIPVEKGSWIDDVFTNTSMVRCLRLKSDGKRTEHDTMHFDTCEECHQDVLDYILSRQADSTAKGDQA